jgi:arabinofuranan 3-O-arabinosyltransferase
VTARRRGATPAVALHLALAAVAYIPLWWSSPGEVSADTKSYLPLDPGRLLAKAPYLWDPTVGMGTVTHQTIGYLWPMGPYYWAMDRLGVPDWVAQRLWLGTLLFVAGAGVVFLLRTWWGGPVGPAVVVASFAYLLSPYVLDYAARISAILMPWAALPWLIAITARALMVPTWRWPALFALVVTTVGGVNATALLFAGLGPALWVAWAVWGAHEVSGRRAAVAVVRIGVLTAGASAWWVAGLVVQGRYGIPILRYTETYDAVAKASTPAEVLRGLGYWFFYGGDKVDRWVGPAGPFLEARWLVVLGFGLVALAVGALVAVRFRHRGFVAALLAVGVVVAVGAHPTDSPSLYGRLFLRFVDTTPGMAMRSTPRAIPLVALALAIALGAGAHALAARLPRYGVLAPAACLVLLAATMPPLFMGDEYSPGIKWDGDIPTYWRQAAAALDAGDHQSRVYELPGSDFASYRWGGTVDPVTPGLMDRPYVARELIPYGSAPSADLLNAFEERLQDGTFDPQALAPFARLIAATTLSVRSDLQFERYRTPRPRTLWAQLQHAGGLGAPRPYGPPGPNTAIARLPLLDEQTLSTPPGAPDPPPAATFPVRAAPEIVHTVATSRSLVVAGDGDGVVDAAAIGLLDDPGAVLYAAALTPAQLTRSLEDGAGLLLTDSNRRRGRRWGSVRENVGYTEQAGEKPLVDDPSDNRLDVFPHAGDDAATVAEQRGVTSVQATSYGNPVTFTPEDRAANALDGDPRTAWRAAAFSPAAGQRLLVRLAQPVTTDHLTLLQPVVGPRNRWMTRVRLRFDGGPGVDVDLADASRRPPGQRIEFGWRTFATVEVEVRADNVGRLPSYQGLAPVGVAELAIGDRPPRVDEVLRLPTDLLDEAGARAAGHRLDVLLTRQRADQFEPVRSDPEQAIARTFTLPMARTLTVTGQARLSGVAPDDRVDAALGLPDARHGGVTAVASDHLPGNPDATAGRALDGDAATAWQTPLVVVTGQSMTVTASAPVTADHLDLMVMADGRHSVPTQLAVSADGGPPVPATVPPIADDASRPNATATVRVALPAAMHGRTLTIRIDAIRAVKTIDYFSEQPVDLPVAVAELGVTGLRQARPPAAFPAACRSDLVSVDGRPVRVRVSGTTTAALARQSLSLTACDAPMRLGAGAHVVRTAVGRDGGLDIDRLLLDSPAAAASAARPAPPSVRVTGATRTSYRLAVVPATEPFWLVLGQSHNDGWQARVDGHDLGPPTLIDGYANGWLVTPSGSAPMTVTLQWTPQRLVWAGLIVSGLTIAVCLALVALDRRRVPEAALDAPVFDEHPLAPPLRQALAAAVIGGLAFAVVAGPVPGLVAVAVALLARAGGRVRRFLWLGPAAFMGATAAFVVAKSVRTPVPPNLGWPGAFDATDVLAWSAVAATVTLVAVRWRRGSPLTPTSPQ